jgi:hypothetical protein
VVGVTAAAVTLLAAAGVVAFLPARPREDEQPAPETRESVPVGAVS